MDIKGFEIYRSLRENYDALCGAIGCAQCKYYVRSFLPIKYISDNFIGEPFARIAVPEGADMEGA
tara:strand:+ start:269 stop:463 length:195 start_codon:yes stop_codon:yes gene_type:complete